MNGFDARKIIGVLLRTLAASTLIATIAFGSGINVARRSDIALTVEDGTYSQTTTASVSGDGTTLAVSATTDLWVWATCYQDGDLVYWENPRVDGGTATLTLGPTAWWTGGAADCTADLKTWDYKRARWKVLTSTTFHVAG